MQQQFVVMIDQEREFMLNLMAQHAAKSRGFAKDLEEYNLMEALNSFKGEMIAGLKNVSWCNHKDCRDKPYSGTCEHKTFYDDQKN